MMSSKRAATIAFMEFLRFLSKLGQDVDSGKFLSYGKSKTNKIPRTSYYRKLEFFENQGFLKRTSPDKREYILTNLAKQLRKKPPIKVNRNDGFSTIIIFDVPEEKHKARDNFRRYLIKNGYTQIQKSVFVSPYKVSEDLKDFAKELKIERDIFVIGGRFEQFVR